MQPGSSRKKHQDRYDIVYRVLSYAFTREINLINMFQKMERQQRVDGMIVRFVSCVRFETMKLMYQDLTDDCV